MLEKYVVPDGMLKAANKAWDHFSGIGIGARIKVMLEAALQWATENPQVPTLQQAQDLREDFIALPSKEFVQFVTEEWQRRMWLSTEPEMIGPETVEEFCSRFRTIREAVIEAYRRGLKAAAK